MNTRISAAAVSGHQSKGWQKYLFLPLVLIAAAMCTAQAHAAPGTHCSAKAGTSYRVTVLAPEGSNPFINDKGQVAFLAPDASGLGGTVKFYDGKTVIDIGTLGGSAINLAGLNERGQIAGSSFPAVGFLPHAFFWSKQTGMVDLGAFPPLPGESFASGINDKGQVVGSSLLGTNTHAVLWSPREPIRDLGTLGGDFSEALAINNAGQVTGRAETAGGNQLAFLWTEAGGMVSIGTLAGGFSVGTMINEAGQIAGISLNAGGESNPFFWSAAMGMLAIGEGGMNSAPRDINDLGMVVGSDTTTGFDRAFVWTLATGVMRPGALGGQQSVALAVNNCGQVVGFADTPTATHAFLWTMAQGIVDLNTLLVEPPVGLILTQAAAINERGEIVALSNFGVVMLTPISGSHAGRPLQANRADRLQ